MAKQPVSRAQKRDSQFDNRENQKLLTIDEIERVRAWGVQQIQQGNREGAVVTTLLGTAGRRFEVAALRCMDVREGPGGPEVYFPAVKGGSNATVPISEETWRLLQIWLQHRAPKKRSDALLPTIEGEFMHVATLWRNWRIGLRAAGVTSQVGVHATRHAAGFLLLRATGDLTKVQKFLRHKSLNTTAVWYSHVHLPDLRAGLTKAGI